MYRRLPPALVCAYFAFVPFSPNQSTDADALHATAADASEISASAVASDSALRVKSKKWQERASVPASSSGSPPRAELQMVQTNAFDSSVPVASSFEAAIGAASDAKLFIDHDAQERRPLTRGAMCQVIREVAEENRLPEPLFTRLIWQESRFRFDVVSRVGAQGIAQFMPATAAERGLQDPFDPLQALPASAQFLSELIQRFGNFGLAAAAYNGGPGRVSRWLAGEGGLPTETRNYVVQITGRTAEHWAETAGEAQAHPEAFDVSDCDVRPVRAALAELSKPSPRQAKPGPATVAKTNPSPIRMLWMAVLTSDWSGTKARSTYAMLQKKYPKVLANRTPKIRAAKAAGNGKAARTVVGIPAETRADAEEVCNRLKKAGGACVVRKDPA
jgi:soluble lytic murein transglycosylase-like protein